MTNQTEVVAIIRDAGMLPSLVKMEGNQVYADPWFTAMLPTRDHTNERASNCSPN